MATLVLLYSVTSLLQHSAWCVRERFPTWNQPDLSRKTQQQRMSGSACNMHEQANEEAGSFSVSLAWHLHLDSKAFALDTGVARITCQHCLALFQHAMNLSSHFM